MFFPRTETLQCRCSATHVSAGEGIPPFLNPLTLVLSVFECLRPELASSLRPAFVLKIFFRPAMAATFQLTIILAIFGCVSIPTTQTAQPSSVEDVPSPEREWSSAALNSLKNFVEAFSEWRNDQQQTFNVSTSNFPRGGLPNINLCSELANLTADSPEIRQFLSERKFSEKQGAGSVERLVQLLRDITNASILVDDIYSRMSYSLLRKARQLGLHGFPQASLATCRLQNEICQALAETGCSNCISEVPFILSSLVSFSDAFLDDNTSGSTMTTRSLRGDIRPMLFQLFAGRNHSRSTNATPCPTDIDRAVTTGEGPWKNGRVCFNSFGCPSPLVESTQRHRLPALTVTLKSLESAFIDAVSNELPNATTNMSNALLACGLPCNRLSQLFPKTLPLSVLLTLHGLNIAILTYALATIFVPSKNRQKFGYRNNVSLRAQVIFNFVTGVWSVGVLMCGAATGWCNSDSTLVQNMALSEVSSECRASAIIENWSMSAMIMAMAWISILWLQTTRSIRIVNTNNRNANRQQTSDTNQCLLILEAGVVAAVAITTYFLFPAQKASTKETNVVDGWPHLGTCTFLAPLSDTPFLALFFTLFATSIVTVVGGVYFKFVHKTEAVAYLRKHKMKLGQWVQTTERRMLLSLITLAIPFVCMFAVVSWLASNDVFETHQERLREYLFCKLISCYPEECARYVRCTCSFGHIDGNLFLRCSKIYWGYLPYSCAVQEKTAQHKNVFSTLDRAKSDRKRKWGKEVGTPKVKQKPKKIKE